MFKLFLLFLMTVPITIFIVSAFLYMWLQGRKERKEKKENNSLNQQKKDRYTKEYKSLIMELSDYAFRYDAALFLSLVTTEFENISNTKDTDSYFLVNAKDHLKLNAHDNEYCHMYLNVLAIIVLMHQNKIDIIDKEILLNQLRRDDPNKFHLVYEDHFGRRM